ncbi:MAG: sulfotransferase [Sphingomonadaceae bacterium]
MKPRWMIESARMAGHAALWWPERTKMRPASAGADRFPYRPYCSSSYWRDIPPIFIIGAPRSGTSLLYELMVTNFRFSYISNLAHRFYLTPISASRIGRSAIHKWSGNFTSRYGHISGWGAPNEGGWIWRRWLEDGAWSDGANLPSGTGAGLQALVTGLSSVLDAPFLNKNTMHSSRLLLLDRIWPDALFIEVRRDPVENARSIIRAERQAGGPARDRQGWWSVRPLLASKMAGKCAIERASMQVLGVTHDIVRDMAEIGPDRLITIDYASLCMDCPRQMERIGDFLFRNGVIPEYRNPVPDHFTVSPSCPLGEREENLLSEFLHYYAAQITASSPSLEIDLSPC